MDQRGPEQKTWKSWFAHAFAVEKPEDIDPSPQQREIVDRLCREIVRRGLATPALMTLEMSRPLNAFSASAMHLLQPIIAAVMDTRAYEQFAKFLEHRGSIDFICARIEHLQADIQVPGDQPAQTERPRDEQTQ